MSAPIMRRDKGHVLPQLHDIPLLSLSRPRFAFVARHRGAFVEPVEQGDPGPRSPEVGVEPCGD